MARQQNDKIIFPPDLKSRDAMLMAELFVSGTFFGSNKLHESP